MIILHLMLLSWNGGLAVNGLLYGNRALAIIGFIFLLLEAFNIKNYLENNFVKKEQSGQED